MIRNRTSRLLSLALAAAVCLTALCIPAGAVDLAEAKASLAQVAVTQTVNGVTTPVTGTTTGHTTDGTVRDLHTASHDLQNGTDLRITYGAVLQMTELMAEYLQPRQENLMAADFSVHIHLDLDKLEFTGSGPLKATFESPFLKPKDGGAFTYRLKGVSGGLFSYELTARRSDVLATGGDLVLPMELIVSLHDGKPLSYAAAKAHPGDKLMYADFTVNDWLQAGKLELAELTVKKSVTDGLPAGGSETIRAYGSVEGTFAYIAGPEVFSVGDLARYEAQNYTRELAFGNGLDITEWVSNEVELLLTFGSGGGSTPGGGGNPGGGDTPGGEEDGGEDDDRPQPDNLNTEDHYSYLIGFTDGTLRPTGTITRGEVATIFFRLLTDEARDKYWSQTNDFPDVPADLWCCNAISTISNMGIVNGMPDGRFHPADKITRAEFAKIAVSFFKAQPEEHRGIFRDVPEGLWYSTFVETAGRIGLINGLPDGTFLPMNHISRAEAAAIVNRTLGRHPHRDYLLPGNVMVVWPDNKPDQWYYADMQEATNSHDYEWMNQTCEVWTKKLPQRDWAALEKAWSEAHSSVGNDVMP